MPLGNVTNKNIIVAVIISILLGSVEFSIITIKFSEILISLDFQNELGIPVSGPSDPAVSTVVISSMELQNNVAATYTVIQ